MNSLYSYSMKFNVLFLICSTLFSIACTLEECEDPIPYVEYKDFIQSGDSATLVLHFRDCDGDFGLPDVSGIPEPPLDYNLFLDYYYYADSAWVKFVPADSLLAPFYYRVPEIENRSVSKTLEGDIHIQMFPYYIPFFGDTIRYEIYIRDLALNESERILTPTIIVP